MVSEHWSSSIFFFICSSSLFSDLLFPDLDLRFVCALFQLFFVDRNSPQWRLTPVSIIRSTYIRQILLVWLSLQRNWLALTIMEYGAVRCLLHCEIRTRQGLSMAVVGDLQLSSLHQWERCNALVLSWIMNSLSKEIFGGIVYAVDASAVWTNLKKQYDKVNGSRIFLSTVRLENSHKLITLYQAITVGWNNFGMSTLLWLCFLHVSVPPQDNIWRMISSCGFSNF